MTLARHAPARLHISTFQNQQILPLSRTSMPSRAHAEHSTKVLEGTKVCMRSLQAGLFLLTPLYGIQGYMIKCRF